MQSCSHVLSHVEAECRKVAIDIFAFAFDKVRFAERIDSAK